MPSLAGPLRCCVPRAGRDPLRPDAVSSRARRGVARALVGVLAAFLVALLVLGAVAPSSASAYSYGAQELEFLQIINDYRAQNGLNRLLLSNMISDACTKHNLDMGKYEFFSHTTEASDYFSVGASPWDRIAASGYNFNTWKGENIAAGYSTAASVFQGWKNSPGHNANMLNANYKVVGISMRYVAGSPYGYYWTTDFGGHVDSTAWDPGGSNPPPDTQPPTVSLLAPVNGSTVSGDVLIDVTATDNVGVTRVEIRINGVLAATDTTAPYQLVWSTGSAANGQYTIEARAYDAANNIANAQVTVTLYNAPPTTTTAAPTATTTAAPTTTTTAAPTTTTTRPPTPTTTTTATPTTTTTTPPPEDVFIDLAHSHPYYAAVVGMKQANIICGYESSEGPEFRPTNPVLRAQFAKMVVGAFELSVSEAMKADFLDLGWDDPHDLYPHQYIAAAAGAGITEGTGRGDFSPWNAIRRAQVVTMIVRATQALRPGTLLAPPAWYEGSFGDFSSVHGENMRVAEYNGLLEGLLGFCPEWDPWEYATRGDVAQMLWNVLCR